MHERGALLALSVIAAALIAVVILDPGGPGQVAGTLTQSRRVFAGLVDADRIARVEWQRPGQDHTVLEQPSPGEFTMPGLPAAAVDQAAARDVLATLELLSHARAERGASDQVLAERGLEPPRVTLRAYTRDGREFSLGLGARIAELDRVWAARERDDTVYLIEGYAARALDRDGEELRARRVFALPHQRISGVELGAGDRDLLLSGRPAAVHVDPGQLGPGSAGGKVLADPAAFAALAERLGELSLARFESGAPGQTASGQTASGQTAAGALTIRVLGGDQPLELFERGPCPGHVGLRLVDTTIGAGCVAASDLDALRPDGPALAGAPGTMLARTVLAGQRPVELSITVPGAAPGHGPLALRAAGRAWALADGADASAATESAAVDAWLHALEQSSSGAYQPVPPAMEARAPALTIDMAFASGQRQRVAVYAGKVPRARRGAEPVVLLLDVEPQASRVLAAGPLMFRRAQLLSLEPYALRSATQRRGHTVVARLERGALLDDWRVRVPARGAPAPGILDALRELGRLRAARFLAEEPAPAHGLTPPRQRIELAFDPGPLDADSAAISHGLDIGARVAGGCAARLDGRGPVFALDARLCDTLTRAWVE